MERRKSVRRREMGRGKGKEREGRRVWGKGEVERRKGGKERKGK